MRDDGDAGGPCSRSSWPPASRGGAGAWARSPAPTPDGRSAHRGAGRRDLRGAACRRSTKRWSASARATRCPNATSATRGIGAARQWIFDELKRSSPKLQVTFDTYQIAPQGRITRQVELRNVMAVLPGQSPRRIYVSGHYDSVNLGGRQTRPTRAPEPAARTGRPRDADDRAAAGLRPRRRRARRQRRRQRHRADDGAGARVRGERHRVRRDAGVHLLGRRGAGAGRLRRRTRRTRRRARSPSKRCLNNDIVGNSRGGNGVVDAETVRVYAVGPRIRRRARWRATSTRRRRSTCRRTAIRLMAREDRFGRGSDQSSFTQQGFPAVVFREANENFERQHCGQRHARRRRLRAIWRRTRASTPPRVASLALAPPAPKRDQRPRRSTLIARDPSGYDATCGGRRRPARSPIASTGATPGRTTGSTADGRQRDAVRACRTCRSTTSCSASRRSAPTGTRAWSAPTSRRCGPGGRSSW